MLEIVWDNNDPLKCVARCTKCGKDVIENMDADMVANYSVSYESWLKTKYEEHIKTDKNCPAYKGDVLYVNCEKDEIKLETEPTRKLKVKKLK
jgi:hypothetical protein